jgi:hypothetical protein
MTSQSYVSLSTKTAGSNPTTVEFTDATPAFYQLRKKIILKTRYAIICVINFYNVGVVTCDRIKIK